VPGYWIVLGLIALGVALGLLYSRLSLLHAGLLALGALVGIAAIDYGLFVFADVDLPALGAMLVPPITWAAIENAWRREAEHRSRARAKELDVARSIQEQMLPAAPPKIAGLDVAGRNIPADSIGGDYFDWIPMDGSLAVVIGDVSGHGIPAALLMAHLRASFHAVGEGGRSPGEMVEIVNRSLARATMPGKFATFFLGLISVGEDRLRYCNAGHNAPLLLRDGQVIELGANGPPIAVVEHMPFAGLEQTFVVGDTLVIYSDGIPEAPQRSQPKQFYGDERLQQRALALAAEHRNAAEIVEGLLDDVRSFAGERMHVDDVTLVVVRRI
jgi:sigma-B regulation protein RsbU (phosphoserine phosphatase)